MADFNKKATNGAVPNPILAQKSDPLHIIADGQKPQTSTNNWCYR